MGVRLAGRLSPTMRQQLFESLDGMLRETCEHIAKPGERIDPDQFARSNETAQNGRYLSAVVTAEEGPVVPAHCEAPQRTFGRIVVYRQVAVCAVTSQRRPVLQRVSDSLSGLALRQHLFAHRQQILMQPL